MKNDLVVLVACMALAACGGGENPRTGADVESASPVFDMPYLSRELDNGLRVIVVRTDYPDIVSLQIPVQTGARNEVEPGKSGFAHFFEHMMFRGTERYSSTEYTAVLKKAGALSNAYTSDDYTNYYITFTKPDLETMIEIEADRFRNLAYSESDFRTEALAVKGEYLKNFSDPLQKAYERLRALAFAEHPYGHTSMGLIEDIEAMPEQLEYSRAFFDRWYRPEYTSLVIVGDVDPEATLDLVARYWGGWERGSHVVDIPAEPPASGPRYEHIQWQDETQPWLLIGFESPAFDPAEKDYPAMSILSSIYFSNSSELYRQLVIDERWVDELLTDFPLNKDPNVNLIYMRLTDESHAADVEAAVFETLARARTRRIAPQQLEQTKSRLRYSFAGTLDNAADIADMLATYVQFERSPETVNTLYRTFDSLTAEDVRRAADRFFIDRTRVTVTVSASPSIDGLGETMPIDERVAGMEIGDTAGAAEASAGEGEVDEVFGPAGEVVPVSIVAMPSDTSPLVDVSIIVYAGAAMDPPGKKGLAALTASMIADGGSASWSISEINAAMYPIASDFEMQVDKEMTRLSGQVHKDNLDTWYRYVRSQFLNPGWREDDFERLKARLGSRVRSDLVGDNDEELGKEVLYSRIYGEDHPYGSFSLGHSGDIEALTLDDVRDFYGRYYTVNNITVGLSGGYPDDFPAKLSGDLQVLPAGERAALDLPEAPAIEGSRVTIVEKATPAVAVSFGFPIALRRGDPDWVALWLARSWLGEHRSENSHLYRRIRDLRGMNYGDYAYIEYFPDGMFRMTPETNLGRQQQIFQVWIRPLRDNNDAHFATRAALFELDKLISEGMSESDFEATRAYLSKSVSLLADGQSRRLGYALDSRYYGIEDFPAYVRRALDSMTLADVNRVIRENLRTDDVHYVFVAEDAFDLRDRLTGETASPISYEAEKAPALLEEDGVIATFPLGVREDDVAIVPAGQVFE